MAQVTLHMQKKRTRASVAPNKKGCGNLQTQSHPKSMEMNRETRAQDGNLDKPEKGARRMCGEGVSQRKHCHTEERGRSARGGVLNA